MADLKHSEIKALLRYEPSTGKLFWMPRTLDMFPDTRSGRIWNTRFANREAFTAFDGQGYRKGGVLGSQYKAHRIAWFLHCGSWPDGDLDHIDGDRGNNQISNLRSVTRGGNNRNRAMSSANNSGFVGVRWVKSRRRWVSEIYFEGKQKRLGYFKTFPEAVHAREAAMREHGFSARHGLDNPFPAHPPRAG